MKIIENITILGACEISNILIQIPKIRFSGEFSLKYNGCDGVESQYHTLYLKKKFTKMSG